jgi:hypothetical protein
MEDRFLKPLQRVLDTVSKINMDTVVLLTRMREEGLDLGPEVADTMTWSLGKAPHRFLEGIEFGNEILLKIVNGDLLPGHFFKMVTHDGETYGMGKHMRIVSEDAP